MTGETLGRVEGATHLPSPKCESSPMFTNCSNTIPHTSTSWVVSVVENDHVLAI